MQIAGVGEGTVQKLYDEGFTTIRAYLRATPEDLMQTPGFQSTSAKKLVDAIRKQTRNAPPVRVMVVRKRLCNLWARS
jgi:NAD-dependent DNA ligase